ncbi:DsbA family protein [uncultured Litoreibacter sp.]|uniref:DsbA family protein n=1 Tax=uncultured Litoreibacter sp. TaxID=1392394 RepID=UPI002622F60D|nr:DsbA family protein [uncultured Litoreibacter sp.]
MNRNLLLAGLAVVAVAIGGFFVMNRDAAPGVTELGSAQAQTASDIDTSMVKEMTIGADDAPITFIEYASYTCPHCQRFHKDVFPQLKADYIDTGKVKFVYREVYFDGPGLWAGMMARCGGEDRFFGLVDLIYENQRTWTQGEPAQIAANLKKMGKLAGLTDAQLDACLQDGEKARAMTAVFQENSQADGVRSTPSFVIDGKLESNMSYDDLKALLDAKL